MDTFRQASVFWLSPSVFLAAVCFELPDKVSEFPLRDEHSGLHDSATLGGGFDSSVSKINPILPNLQALQL
jgi:hypothetical protein